MGNSKLAIPVPVSENCWLLLVPVTVPIALKFGTGTGADSIEI
jgi:hypothetical protein